MNVWIKGWVSWGGREIFHSQIVLSLKILVKPNIPVFVINKKKRVNDPIANEKNIVMQNYLG